MQQQQQQQQHGVSPGVVDVIVIEQVGDFHRQHHVVALTSNGGGRRRAVSLQSTVKFDSRRAVTSPASLEEIERCRLSTKLSSSPPLNVSHMHVLGLNMPTHPYFHQRLQFNYSVLTV